MEGPLARAALKDPSQPIFHFFGAEDQTLQLRFSRVAGFPRNENASFSDFSAIAQTKCCTELFARVQQLRWQMVTMAGDKVLLRCGAFVMCLYARMHFIFRSSLC